MVIFRLLIEHPQMALLGADNPEDYEHLTLWWRFLLPIAGALLIGFWFEKLAAPSRQVGLIHVMECLAYREGQLPLKNALVQFCSAAVCMISGHSVGREGPSIHIGAACGSWFGQQLRFPNNSIRVLIGCGSAGAIAAAFNTPLAGVIFTMEVVMAEYTLASFTPIILAAVSATAVSRWVFGAAPIFIVPDIHLESLGELFYIVIMGSLIGVIATIFVRLLIYCTTLFLRWRLWQRLALAGVITGMLALPVPQIMGIGYDTVNMALLGQLSLGLLLTILVAKLIATACGLGLGLPGGVIGPSLVIGAVAGGACGVMLNAYLAADTSPAFYAMLGMGAMMGATLNAPLAALTALLELTYNPHVILPGMLAIVAANLTSQRLSTIPSVLLQLLHNKGFSLATEDPLAQFLRRVAVSVSMDRRVQQVPAKLSAEQIKDIIANPPTWLLLRTVRPKPQVIFTADLLRYLEDQSAAPEESLNLTSLPIQKQVTAPISARATLLATQRKMHAKEVDILYVVSAHNGRVMGIITREAIERSYRNPL